MRQIPQVPAGRRPAQRGYTMIELMVSMAISLFLLGGLVTLVMHSRTTSAAQQQLAQLQDNQRIAMTVLANVIQQAGYFPDPTVNGATLFPVESDTATAGQVAFAASQPVGGIAAGAAPGDAIGVRFASPKADAAGILPATLITCAGTSSTDTAAVHVYTNVFQVATDASGTTWLQCLLYRDGALNQTVNLVPGLYDMQVAYGVSATTDNNVVKYLPASAMSSGDWNNVTSVKVRLYFQLPQYGMTGGQVNAGATSQALGNQTQYIERVIGIMNRSGG